MRVVDLLAIPSLELRLETPTATERLNRSISRCAPTEHLDPTPFLDNDVLILTYGISMNFTEQAVWDAYVERLTHVPISALAFATGTAHAQLPPGLIVACTNFDMPLLEVPTTVPILKIDQHVESVLQAERFELLDRGWALADECARLASHGAEISTLLAAIYTAVQRPIAVYDAFDAVIARYPESTTWRTDADHAAQPDVLTVPLPMGLNNPCHLAVQRLSATADIEALLAPVSSILALQLNRSVVVDASSHQEVRRFVARCLAWSESTRSDVARSFQELGLERRAETALIVADMSGEHAASAWQLRLLLHDAFHEVRIAEFDDRMIALAQFPREEFETVAQRILTLRPALPLVIRQPARTIDELRIAVVHALDLVRHVDQPTHAPALGLSAIIAAVAGRGAREAAERFLAPVVAYDQQRDAELLTTLQTWLSNDAQPSRTCEELFIHRNSLSYRLQNMEKLLGLSLSTLEGRTTCLMALRLVQIEPY